MVLIPALVPSAFESPVIVPRLFAVLPPLLAWFNNGYVTKIVIVLDKGSLATKTQTCEPVHPPSQKRDLAHNYQNRTNRKDNLVICMNIKKINN